MLSDVTRPPDIECEIKIPVDTVEPIRQRLQQDGWRLHRALHREVNVLFDTPDGRLRGTDVVLRLRRSGTGWTVTYKGPAHVTDGVKSREELEVTVDDGATFAAIMLRLGLSPSRRYEKDRETWAREDLLVALDHTPMGDFVEIEGPADRLAGVATALELDPARAVTRSYPALWEDHRRRHAGGALPEHMVFEAP